MKKLFLTLLIGLGFFGTSYATTQPVVSARFPKKTVQVGVTGFQTATDLFNYTGGTLLGSQPNWTNVDANSILTVDVNGAAKGIRGTSAGFNSVVFYNQLTWSPNQYAQATIISVGGTTINNGGVAVRCNATSGGNGYYIVYSAGTIYVNKCNSGVHSTATTLAISLTIGNSLRLAVTGSGSSTRLTVTADTGSGYTVVSGGSSIDPAGTYINSGSPGISSYDTASSQGQWGTWFASEQ